MHLSTLHSSLANHQLFTYPMPCTYLLSSLRESCMYHAMKWLSGWLSVPVSGCHSYCTVGSVIHLAGSAAASTQHTRPKIESWCGRHTAAGPPLINSAITCSNLCQNSRGRILGRNLDKSLKSFPPCYSESPLHICIEIYISSNSRNLLQFR